MEESEELDPKTLRSRQLASKSIQLVFFNRPNGLVVERPPWEREVAGSIPGRVIPKT